MANITRLSRVPPCIFCVSRIINHDITNIALPFYRQLRGKKHASREPKTVTVKLLQDVVGYGPQGSIVPMVPGRMRNLLYPKHQAAYIPEMELRQYKKKGIIFERDIEFGIEKSEEEKDPAEIDPEEDLKVDTESIVDVQVKLLSPQRATEIISTLLPPLLVFYRAPISTSEPELSRHEASKRDSNKERNSAASDLAAASAPPPKPQLTAIFGSVSTADIAESIKAVLGETEEGGRIVLGPEDVTILREKEEESNAEADRLKELGDFAVDIQVKGGDSVRRRISIRAQES